MRITHCIFISATVLSLVAGCARTPKWTTRGEYTEYDWITMLQSSSSAAAADTNLTDLRHRLSPDKP